MAGTGLAGSERPEVARARGSSRLILDHNWWAKRPSMASIRRGIDRRRPESKRGSRRLAGASLPVREVRIPVPGFERPGNMGKGPSGRALWPAGSVATPRYKWPVSSVSRSALPRACFMSRSLTRLLTARTRALATATGWVAEGTGFDDCMRAIECESRRAVNRIAANVNKRNPENA